MYEKKSKLSSFFIHTYMTIGVQGRQKMLSPYFEYSIQEYPRNHFPSKLNDHLDDQKIYVTSEFYVCITLCIFCKMCNENIKPIFFCEINTSSTCKCYYSQLQRAHTYFWIHILDFLYVVSFTELFSEYVAVKTENTTNKKFEMTWSQIFQVFHITTHDRYVEVKIYFLLLAIMMITCKQYMLKKYCKFYDPP